MNTNVFIVLEYKDLIILDISHIHKWSFMNLENIIR